MDDIEASCAADLRVLCPVATSEQLEGVAHDLVERWTAPDRAYHSLRHLAELLAALGLLEAQGQIARADVVVARVAGWYHDAVQGRGAGADEEASAELALTTLDRLGADPAVADRVAGLVLATADHVPTDDPACAAFLDADLWVLAAPASRYDEYSAQVRTEHPHVADEAFAAGRRAVLDGLLAHDHLYATDYGRAHWEQPARANLTRELAGL